MSTEAEQSTNRVLTPKEVYQRALKSMNAMEEELIKFREEKARRYGSFNDD